VHFLSTNIKIVRNILQLHAAWRFPRIVFPSFCIVKSSRSLAGSTDLFTIPSFEQCFPVEIASSPCMLRVSSQLDFMPFFLPIHSIAHWTQESSEELSEYSKTIHCNCVLSLSRESSSIRIYFIVTKCEVPGPGCLFSLFPQRSYVIFGEAVAQKQPDFLHCKMNKNSQNPNLPWGGHST
jgi:hypothetical protein